MTDAARRSHATLGIATHGLDLEARYPVIDKGNYESIEGRIHEVTIEKRPAYCDRGHWIAKVFPVKGAPFLDYTVDDHDAWPRYYMRREAMLEEVRAWLAWREEGQP